jgi:two-component system, OmpR family, copper resistance phosphate regulon response regulator CusR
MEAKVILLAEGEKLIADRLCKTLKEAQYKVDLALDGNMARQMFNLHNYDLVLIDLRLSDKDGVELCSYIRNQDSEIPLMMLSRSNNEIKIEVSETGADACLVLTDDLRELLLRIKVLTGRVCRTLKQKNRIAAGDIIMDLDTGEVLRGGRSIYLSAKEFLLLKYLVSNKNKIVSRTEIAHTIYNKEFLDKEHRVAAFINSLRGKIEEQDDEKTIFTVTGKGYLLAERKLLADRWHN